MATIKTTTVTYSCPKCKRQLFCAPQNTYDIGSPILSCPICQLHFRNPMKDEWFNYSKKLQAFLLPALMPLMMGGVMWLLTAIGSSDLDPGAMLVLGGIIGLIIGVVIAVMNVVRIIKSKKRMKSRRYLSRLLSMNIITMADFEALEKSATQE